MIPADLLLLAPLHMGKLHAYEQVLVYLLAFGPFLLLALTIWISRRRNAEDTEEADDTSEFTTPEDSTPEQ